MTNPTSLMKSVLRRSRILVESYSKARWKIHILKDWWGTKVWRRTTEVATPLGFKLTSGFHPAYALMRTGAFEKAETELIGKLFKVSDVFVDIGANLGYYTCFALQNDKQVIAFEPQPQNLRCLCRNLISNDWDGAAEVFPIGLSHEPGLMTLYGASGPSASLIKNWAGYSPRHRQTIPVNTLDNILGGRLLDRRLLIKIDVEGAEYQVLRGATSTLARTPRPIWLLEICLQEYHPGGVNPDYRRIFQLFWDNGYRAFTCSEEPAPVEPSQVEEWIRNQRSDSGTFNYFFFDREKTLSDLHL